MEHPAGGSHFQKMWGGANDFFRGRGQNIRNVLKLYWGKNGSFRVSGFIQHLLYYFQKNHYKTVRKTNKQ